MEIKKLLENPMVLSIGISSFGVAIIEATIKNPLIKNLFITCLSPIAILISFGIAWLVSKCFTFTFEENQALSVLKKREKIILKDLKNPHSYLTSKTKKELQEELNKIAITKSQIGKKDTVVDSDNHTTP